MTIQVISAASMRAVASFTNVIGAISFVLILAIVRLIDKLSQNETRKTWHYWPLVVLLDFIEQVTSSSRIDILFQCISKAKKKVYITHK
jgi:hypothetical protein